jgi:hypothetical protein
MRKALQRVDGNRGYQMPKCHNSRTDPFTNLFQRTLGAIWTMKMLGITLSLVATALAVIAFCASQLKPIPRSMKLVECTNTAVTFTFTCPLGDSYNIALGVKGTKDFSELSQLDCRGRLRIVDGERVVCEFDFPISEARHTLWLKRDEGIAGYFVTVPSAGSPYSLERLLKPTSRYEGFVTFSNLPPGGISLWLSWRQKRIEQVQ